MADDEDRGGINLDALSLVLADHPQMVEDAPDLVALAQTYARAVDLDSRESCSQCKRTGLNAQNGKLLLTVLLELHDIGGGDEDGADELAERASRPSKVGDAEN